MEACLRVVVVEAWLRVVVVEARWKVVDNLLSKSIYEKLYFYVYLYECEITCCT